MAGAVGLSIEGRVARIVLGHPGKLNAMSRTMWRELRAHFQAVRESTGTGCVIVSGEGGAFCAGGDIAEYPAFRFDEKQLAAFHEEDVWGGLEAMLDCDVPVVAQLEGACMGAGVEIASCCDIRIAGESSTFGAPIARLGFPMAPREAQIVARAAGEVTVREWLLEAAVLGAPEMKSRGFLTRVVADGAVAAEAEATARRIVALSPQAARLNKATLRQLLESQVRGAYEDGAYRYADSAEHREGIAAFLEKRKPDFQKT